MRPVFRIIVLLFVSAPPASGQDLSANSICFAISCDSGNPPNSYLEYAAKLEKTLASLTPAQLSRVFEGVAISTGVSGSATFGSGTSNGNDGSDGDGGDSGISNPDTAESPRNNAPPNDPVVDCPLIDLIAEASDPEELKGELIAASPLSQAVLDELVAAGDRLPPEIMFEILMENAPLPEETYLKLITSPSGLEDGQLATPGGCPIQLIT